jgi:hypothetical protein
MPLLIKTGLAALIVALVGGGFFMLFNNRLSDNTELPAIAKLDNASPDMNATEGKRYLVAKPHYGPLVLTFPLTVTYDNEKDLARARIESKESAALHPRQQVILYNLENNVLPLGGRVTSIRENNGGTQVLITLPDQTDTALLSPQPEVITRETIASQRVPLTALQQDEAGRDYVWIAEESNVDEGYSLRRRYVSVVNKDKFFFETDLNVLDTHDLIVVNPDANLGEGMVYNMHVTPLFAPLHNPIKQAEINHNLRQLALAHADMKEIYEACARGESNSLAIPIENPETGGMTQASCGTLTQTPDAMQIFKALTERGSFIQNGNISGSCGGACGS